MASIFGHAIAATAIQSCSRSKNKKYTTRLLLLCIISAVMPDIDVLAFKLHIPYGSPFGHRGFTHSIFFAVIWSGFLSVLFFPKNRQLNAFLFLFIATLSHGLLDACTTGGKGVGFFIPFDNDRYFLPWQYIKVSPLGWKRFFSSWGLKVIQSEFLYIFIPSLLLIIFNRWRGRKSEA